MRKKALGIIMILIGIFGILTPFTPFGIPAFIAGLTLLGWRGKVK